MRRNVYSGYASVSSGASTQLIASASGTRFGICDLLIRCYNASASSQLSLKEVGNAVSSTIFHPEADASGRIEIDHTFMEPWKASDTNTALRMALSVEGTATALFCYTYDG